MMFPFFVVFIFLLVSCNSQESYSQRTGVIIDGKLSPKVVEFLKDFYDRYHSVIPMEPIPSTRDPKALRAWSQKYMKDLSQYADIIKFVPQELESFMSTTNKEAQNGEVVVIPGCRARSMYRLSSSIKNASRVVFFATKERSLDDVDFDSDLPFIKELKGSCDKPRNEYEAAEVILREFSRSHSATAVLLESKSKSFVGGVEALLGFFGENVPTKVVFYHIKPYGKDKELTVKRLFGSKANRVRFFDAFTDEKPFMYYQRLSILIYASCESAGIS